MKYLWLTKMTVALFTEAALQLSQPIMHVHVALSLPVVSVTAYCAEKNLIV